MTEPNAGGDERTGWRGTLQRWFGAVRRPLGRAGNSPAHEQAEPRFQRSTAPVAPVQVPAIVLTCDRYRPLTEHMIMRYDAEWPSHPFTFHVPYQRQRIQGPRIASRQTPEAIRATVLELLDEFDGEAWVYWCIDDKYPIRLLQPSVTHIAEAVVAEQLPWADGLIFCRCRNLLLSEYLFDETREDPNGVVLLRRKDYSQFWIHQFLRVKVIRQVFQQLPESIPQAKMMDAMLSEIKLPDDHRLYVVETNLARFGESTIRGRITRNCAASLLSHGLGVPPAFEGTDAQSFMGTIEAGEGGSG
jgi:hypothetical protein